MSDEFKELVHEFNLHLKEMVGPLPPQIAVSLPPPPPKPVPAPAVVVVEKKSAPPPPPPPKEDWKAVLQKAAPDLKMSAAPPRDDKAKEEAALFRQNSIAAQILLLASGKGEALLQNLARALMKRGHTVKILDAKRLGVRLEAILEVNRFLVVIAYSEMRPLLEKSKANFLFLDGEESYTQSPEKKKKLWDLLCTQLTQKSS